MRILCVATGQVDLQVARDQGVTLRTRNRERLGIEAKAEDSMHGVWDRD